MLLPTVASLLKFIIATNVFLIDAIHFGHADHF